MLTCSATSMAPPLRSPNTPTTKFGGLFSRTKNNRQQQEKTNRLLEQISWLQLWFNHQNVVPNSGTYCFSKNPQDVTPPDGVSQEEHTLLLELRDGQGHMADPISGMSLLCDIYSAALNDHPGMPQRTDIEPQLAEAGMIEDVGDRRYIITTRGIEVINSYLTAMRDVG